MKHKYHLVLVLLAGVWIGAAVAQEANIERVIAQVPNEAEATAGEKTGQVVEGKRATQAEFSTTSPGNGQLNGVDWADQQFWLVEMTDLLDRSAVNAAWRDLRTRFPRQMENRTILPRRQDSPGNTGEDSALRYKLFIAKFPEKQMAEEFCAMLRAGQQRCGVASSDLLAGKDVLNVASVPDKGEPDRNTQAVSEAESARVKAEQEAEEKARQEAEARVAKLKAKQEAKAEAERLKAEQESKALAEKQVLAEAKAEAARQKAEKKTQVEAEKKAAAEEKARQVAEAKAEAARLKAEKKAQVEAEKQAAAEAKKAAKVEAARLKAEQEAQAAAEAEPARMKAEQEAEEKARQEAEARVAKLKAKQEAKAEAERLKAEQEAKALAEKQTLAEAKAEAARLKAEKKAQAEVEKQAAAEAKKTAKAEAARLKAEQKSKAEALAVTANMQVAVVEPEALPPKVEVKQAAIAELEAVELKTGQKVKQYFPEDAEKKAKVEELAATETKQKAEAEVAQVNAEKKAQADVGGDAKATKPKTSEGTMEDFAQNVATTKAEQKSQEEAKNVEEAKAAKLKAAKSDMMVDFAQKAVLNNPDVLSRWHSFQAAISETAAAEGAFYPQLDVTVDGGRERGMSTGSSYSVNTKTGTVTLTQLLYDGFATLNEVRRLNNAQLARYYELLDASEAAALEAVRAFYDVSRQRKLFELTEDNYVRHRTAFEQIKLKVEAGVGRRVDLEQAAGRLALSESNLTLDNANVHDASARFQRIIGELPPTKIRKSPSQAKLAKKILPNAADALLSVAVESHPSILAAVENVRSSRYDLYGREAKYQPTVKLNVAQSHNKNMAGVDGTTGNASAKIMLNWNLFSGGSDSARSAQYAKKLDAARDMRDKACRDVRMNLVIAYNDISKLKEQLNYMDQHQLSIEKARVAYQKQFEIGQRSLLDLLDTENELYQARRSYTNAEYDLAIAAARTHAGMGQLVSSLEISRLETADLPELLGVSSDAAENCPPEAPIANNIRKDELDARAIEEARAAIDASRAKEEAEKEKKAKEDEEFLMTPGEAQAAKLKKEQGVKASETEPAGQKVEPEVATGGKAKQAVEASAPKNKPKKEAKEKAASTP